MIGYMSQKFSSTTSSGAGELLFYGRLYGLRGEALRRAWTNWWG